MKRNLKFYLFTNCILLALLLTACTSAQGESTQSKNQQKDKEQPIAVQGAMDVEVSSLLDEMGDYEEEKHGNYSFYIGEIDDVPVVVSRTEVGMVNAATSTTLLIENYRPRAIINQGTAGGHDPNIHVFDTVIGNEVMNIGSFRTEHLDEGKGMEPEKWNHTPTEVREENGELNDYASFKSDPELVNAALSVTDKYEPGEVTEGKIGSADFWNREIDRIQWFHEEFGTSAEEMEAASVAQVANDFDIPYLSMRTISNSEVTNDNIEDLEKAGQYGAEFAVEVVKAIGK